MIHPHPSSKRSLIQGVAIFLVMIALVIGPRWLGWLEPQPGLLPLTVVALGLGSVGFFAFLITLRAVHQQDIERHQAAIAAWQQMSPGEFETYVAGLFRTQGYQARVVEREGRVDLLVKKEAVQGVVQCNHWLDRRVGVGAVHELAVLVNQSNATQGFLVTSGGFTYPAQERTRAEPVVLIDGNDLIAWLKAARQEPYAMPFHYPLRFSLEQWLFLMLLGPITFFILGVWLLN